MRGRLSRPAFLQVSHGTRRSSAHFTIAYRIPAQTTGASVVISKKVAPHATDRNLLRRRLFHVIGVWQSVHPHTALIVYTKPRTASLPFKAIELELTGLLDTL